jgi:protein TonB
MDIAQRDALYRRRLAIIASIVIPALLLVAVGAVRNARRDASVQVGWKGDMELLPEITIEPEVPAQEAAPAPEPEATPEPVALELAERSDFEVSPPVREAQSEPDPGPPEEVEVEARGAAPSEAARSSPDISYSDTYVILRMVKPKYPPHEQAAGIEGNVTVELLVDEEGKVAQASVLGRVGPRSFEDAALDAVRLFEFQPPVEDGQPTSMWIKFVIKFRMY